MNRQAREARMSMCELETAVHAGSLGTLANAGLPRKMAHYVLIRHAHKHGCEVRY